MTGDERERGTALLSEMDRVISDAGLLLAAVDSQVPVSAEDSCYALGFVVDDFMDLAEKMRDYLRGVLETATVEHVEALMGDSETPIQQWTREAGARSPSGTSTRGLEGPQTPGGCV